ncbi:hypothetical protein ACP70R_045685 [Stipagrostis hirtigluma subsp. patula]
MADSAAAAEDPPPPATPSSDPQTLARWYQLEALERAVRENTVVFLETGAGKTLIAVLLLRAYAHRVRRPASRAFAVFLVPTVVLVWQQARVVEAHTDLRVKQFYGDMGVDSWGPDTWRSELEDAEVLVMTPQILLDNLRRSYFRLQDIALLIFDECHRARRRSPYACILKEFYHPQLNSRPSDPLPRIFGMTASLINSKGLEPANFSKKILKLEELMNAKVYTVGSESALSQYIPFATTRMVQYDDSIIPPVLYSHIVTCLDRLKEKSNLGVWLAAKAAEVQSCNESCLSFWGEKLNEKVERFIRNYMEDVHRELLSYFSKRGHIGEDLAADLRDGLLTSKVYYLIKFLLEYRHMQDLRCIVFVERVITSIVLESLLSTLHQMFGWNVRYMAGNNQLLQYQRRKEHMEIVDSFRKGKVHLIIATQILEEGLDVPSCNLVIRFDQSATLGDTEALSRTRKFLASGQIMREESLRLASTPCQPLENTLCEDQYYRVQSTGAIVTLNSSVRLIYIYCSKLPSDEYFKSVPRFSIDRTLGTCTLHLPKSCPVQTIHAEGDVSVLKRVVCLQACRELHAIGALTDHLLPELDVPCEDEPDIVVDKYKSEQPDYFPEQLVDKWFSFSRLGLYYCYKISLVGCFKTTTPADIVLAVKCDMGSDFISNSFKLWGGQDHVSVTMEYLGIIHLNQEQVIIARRYQTTILSLLISNDHSKVNESYTCEMQESYGVVYLLLPFVSGKVDWCSIKFLAWPMSEADNKETRHCHLCKDAVLLQTIDGPVCRCMLENCVVCTPHNGMLYAVTGFLDLNANSLMHRNDGSVVSYKTHFKTRHGLNLMCEDQPLLAASRLLKKYVSTNAVELPPELCRVVMSPVSANILCSFSFLPSIMHRVQCMLLSVKLKIQLAPRMQQFDIPSLKVLEALTTKKCQEEFSQESLETLGDSFLKYITTQHLFSKYSFQHEGMLTKMKKNLISNAALCQLACNNNLVGYIRDEEFNPETWIIPGLGYDTAGNRNIICLSSNTFSLRKMSIKSKRIADSIEALIGAYLSAAGEQAAFLFMKSLGMDIEFHSEVTFERKIATNSEELINLGSLAVILGYEFNDPLLLMEALTHGSYQIAGTTACYQRLEFLGDAVLDHIFTDYFYRHYPECTPELLTDLRSASVNNSCYAHAAVKAGLHKHVLHSSSELHKRMAYYLENFQQSFSGPSHGWEAGIGLPKVLGDVIESIAGAIYVDSKHNKEVVWRSMRRLLEPLATPDTLESDPMKELQEFCDRKSYSITYTVTHQKGESSVVAEVKTEVTTYSATRSGPTKLVAKKLAAKAVLGDMKTDYGTQQSPGG